MWYRFVGFVAICWYVYLIVCQVEWSSFSQSEVRDAEVACFFSLSCGVADFKLSCEEIIRNFDIIQSTYSFNCSDVTLQEPNISCWRSICRFTASPSWISRSASSTCCETAGIRWPIWVIAALCIFDPGLGAWKFYRCSVSWRSQSLKPNVCVFFWLLWSHRPQSWHPIIPNLEISLMGACCSSLPQIWMDDFLSFWHWPFHATTPKNKKKTDAFLICAMKCRCMICTLA